MNCAERGPPTAYSGLWPFVPLLSTLVVDPGQTLPKRGRTVPPWNPQKVLGLQSDPESPNIGWLNTLKIFRAHVELDAFREINTAAAPLKELQRHFGFEPDTTAESSFLPALPVLKAHGF